MDANYTKIMLLAGAYKHHKRIVEESETGMMYHHPEDVQNSYRIVRHIDMIIEDMREPEKSIVVYEVQKNKSGKWYLDYYAPSTYYRLRKIAYNSFLNCL